MVTEIATAVAPPGTPGPIVPVGSPGAAIAINYARHRIIARVQPTRNSRVVWVKLHVCPCTRSRNHCITLYVVSRLKYSLMLYSNCNLHDYHSTDDQREYYANTHIIPINDVTSLINFSFSLYFINWLTKKFFLIIIENNSRLRYNEVALDGSYFNREHGQRVTWRMYIPCTIEPKILSWKKKKKNKENSPDIISND